MKIAVIPARGGSKRIPRKNIKSFCGRPMIAWSIKAAQDSGLFDRIIVSTDDSEIRETSIRLGVEAPFERPKELANDHAPTLPVIRHAVQWMIDDGEPITYACCIYATAPFLEPEDLKQGIDLLNENDNLDFAFSVTRFDYPIQRALRMDLDNKISMFQPEHELSRSQDLPTAYHDAGQFYWGTSNAWLSKDLIFSSSCRGVLLPSSRAQDIDTNEDWLEAELKFRILKDLDND